ncbi:MAG: PKD domain-containing protein, partial [Methanoregulaceae archaeon]|nr:PKD domain-containing protein [Methanoregulaceae archaeon]
MNAKFLFFMLVACISLAAVIGFVSAIDIVPVYAIEASAGQNGTIDPAGTVFVPVGENQTFVITPEPTHLSCWGGGMRYVVWDVLVDGVSINMSHPSTTPVVYNFTDVQKDHTIHATFEQMIIDARPSAQFSGVPTIGFAPFEVNFTQVRVSKHDSVLWDFGDNTTSVEENTTHTYENPGMYNVSLTIFCDDESFTETQDRYITAFPHLPPIGGDKGYFLVHCNVDGASVFFDSSFKGLTENGTLLVQVYVTATPYRNLTVEKAGYRTFSAPITDYPSKNETVDLYATLIPATAVMVRLDGGWNLFSTPIVLDGDYATLGQIFDQTAQSKIDTALGWDGYWFSPDENYRLSPLTALYIRVNDSETINAILIPSESPTSPPTRNLPAGVSLIGPAPAFSDTQFTVMPLDQAFVSVDQVTGGLTGYVMVISPGLNQPSWAYARGGQVQDILPFKGYWMVMTNPGTLAGFSTTPLPNNTEKPQLPIMCNQPYGLCDISACDPMESDPTKALCTCSIEDGVSLGMKNCSEREAIDLYNSTEGWMIPAGASVGQFFSTFSFKNSLPTEEGKIPNRYIDPDYTGNIVLKRCQAPLWANCLDQPCVVPPADPSADITVDHPAADYAICECALVNDTPEFYMATDEGEAACTDPTLCGRYI